MKFILTSLSRYRELKQLNTIYSETPREYVKLERLSPDKYYAKKITNIPNICSEVSDITLIKSRYLKTKDNYLITRELTFHDYSVNFSSEEYNPTEIKKGIETQEQGYIEADEVESKQHFNDPGFLLNGGYGSLFHFGHWFLEHLPKIIYHNHINKNLELQTLYVNKAVPKAFLRWIEIFAKSKFKITFYDGDLNPSFTRIWVPTPAICRPKLGVMSVWIEGLREFRNLGLLKVGANAEAVKTWYPKSSAKVLFIGRKSAKWRKLVNEDDFLNRTKERFRNTVDFDLEQLPPEQQIYECQSANLIIVVAGSSEAILCFARRGSTVIHIIPDKMKGEFGAPLWATLLSLDYHRLNGTGIGRNFGNLLVDEDFEAPLNIYLSLLDKFKDEFARCYHLKSLTVTHPAI